ncbi:MAG: hypothetical protein LRY71_03730 [Bacillaceae bacterium]|nr:hypothetical protein [Bacillaceae bacterium]
MAEQQNPQPRRSLFDSMMFGPPPADTSGVTSEEVKKPEQQVEMTTEQPNDKESTNNNNPPEIDMAQMMQTIDTLMGYADKFGPTLKKMGPLLDILKGFSSPKK